MSDHLNWVYNNFMFTLLALCSINTHPNEFLKRMNIHLTEKVWFILKEFMD